MIDASAKVHPTALVEKDVSLGAGTSVWDNVHIRHGATIGSNCIVGEKTYIAYDVDIGSRVKLNAAVYICAGVSIAEEVMISAGVVFTNDLFPRACHHRTGELRTSTPDEHTLETKVEKGVTVGANATIGPGITLGEYSMIGMGSVVTRSVAPFTLVVGNPARPLKRLCACGHPLGGSLEKPECECQACGQKLRWEQGTLSLETE